MSSGHESNRYCPRTRVREPDRSRTIAGSSRESFTATGLESLGATCLVSTSAPGKQCGSATVGTWDRVLAHVLSDADAADDIDWNVSVDGTINRAHQHATNTTPPDQDTGGYVELQESARFAG